MCGNCHIIHSTSIAKGDRFKCGLPFVVKAILQSRILSQYNGRYNGSRATKASPSFQGKR